MKKYFSCIGLVVFMGCTSVPVQQQESDRTQLNVPITRSATLESQMKPAAVNAIKNKKENKKLSEAPAKAPTFKNEQIEGQYDGYAIVQDVDLKAWKKVGDDDGVQTYQKRDDIDGLVVFRGEVVVPASIIKVASVIDDASIRKEWIDALAESRVLSQPDRLNRVEYNHTKAPWPFHDRDFIYKVNVKVSRAPVNSMVLTMKSSDDQLVTPPEGVVRGKIIYCYYYIRELEPGKSTKIAVEMAVDPMGSIPKWLVNLSQRKWPQNTLRNLRKLSQRDNLTIPSDLETYYKGGGG